MNPETELGDETLTVLVNARCKDKNLTEAFAPLITYIRTGKVTGAPGNVISKIDNVITDARHDGRWSMDYIRYQQAEMDIGRKYEEAGRREGHSKGLREGREKGLREGEARMARLIASLLENDRGSEISQAASDKEYREKLYSEFGL